MPSIRDFSGGVVNQELLGKDGGAGIMIDANNVLSSWNGELRKRTGSRIVAQLEKKSRIIPYRLPNNDDALLLFSDGNVKGYEITDAGLSPLSTGYSKPIDYPSENWGFFSDFVHILDDGTHEYPFTLSNGGEYTIDGWKTKYIMINSKTPSAIKSVDIDFVLRHGADTNGYFYFTSPVLLFSDDASNWTAVKTSFTETLYPFSQTGGTTLTGTNTATIRVFSEESIGAHKHWKIRFDKRVSNTPPNYYGDLIPSVFVVNIVATSLSSTAFNTSTSYKEADLEKIKFSQLGSDIYFACQDKTPFIIELKENTFKGNLFKPSETIWEDNGTPSCVAGFQNRLAWSGFSTRKNRIILSEFGEYENYTVKTTDVKPTDPISVDSVEIKSTIDNLWAGNNALYALSSDGVSMLDAQGGVIATDQINFKLRNRESADGMTPTTKDDIMIYLGNDRRKIFITDYDFIVQRFKAKDLSIGYNGFLTSRIVALHYASRKCSLIYGYKDDGNMLALLFDVDLQKNALFPCNIAGDIKDMQVFKSGDKFRVLMVVQIEDRWYLIEKNEQPEYSVMDFMTKNEKIAYTENLMRNGLYLDCMTRRYYNSPVSTITDLPYGKGEYVAVFADGQYIGERICSSGGPYAWKRDNIVIYTKKEQPESGAAIYDDKNVVIENKTVVSSTQSKLKVRQPQTKKLYCWVGDLTGYNYYTESETPSVGDIAYDDDFPGRTYTVNAVYTGCISVGKDLEAYRTPEKDKEDDISGTTEIVEYLRNSEKDLSSGLVGVRLDEPAKDFVLGYNYDAYAVLKLATPYTSKKYPKEVATYLINTGYLEIGNSFDNLQPILNNMRDKLDLFDKPMLLNGEYTKTMDKLDNSPYIILRSNEPMPFMITGIDFKVDYSNYQGGI